MPGSEAFREALAALDRTLTDLEAVAARTDADRKRDLVVQRRLLAEGMVAVQRAAATPGSPMAQPEMAEEFQRQFSKIRNAVALHQATWSVVLIDDSPAEYRESSRAASAALRGFLAWARGASG